MQISHDQPEQLLQHADQKIRLICKAAQMVLENGGETYRVEETAMRMAVRPRTGPGPVPQVY